MSVTAPAPQPPVGLSAAGAPVPAHAVEPDEEIWALSVEQYHQMIRQGILPDGAPVELIDGLLVWKDRSAHGSDPRSHGPRHGLTIKRLQRLDVRLKPFDCHLQLQLPITLSDTSEPEPDAAIVKGAPEGYSDHHPTATYELQTKLLIQNRS